MSEKPNKMEDNGNVRDEKGKFVAGHPPLEGAGRPVFSLTAILKEELQKVPKDQQESYAIMLIKRMLKSAIADGNDQQIKIIWAYIEGMPKQNIDLSTLGEKIQGIDVNIIDGKITDNGDKRP